MSAEADVGQTAESIVARLDSEVGMRTLAPFGDGPFELQFAEELKRELGEGEPLARVLDYTLRLCWSQIVDPAAGMAAFRRFASLAFVLRFCDAAPSSRLAYAAIQLLIDKARVDPEARFALADFVRTLARTGGDAFDLGGFDIDADNDDPEFLSAFVELLVEQRSEDAFPILATMISREFDVSVLLWNFAQDRAFADLFERAPFGVRVDVRQALEAALIEMDPGGDALARWNDMVLETADEPDFSMFDYRRVE